ncbi:ATP-binding protein [Glaciihabitans sp. INWT7]|uniref:ATP-binding protein n=1 Tax=Glaciihabitans sp. INWT7 TaxID=2596912 RepID=UPI001626126F|nr:ATP-binding protein [Glaciihabitans sp. INWT7]
MTLVRALGARPRFAIIAGLLLLTYVLGTAAVVLMPPNSQTAAWWPAAGAGVVAVLCARKQRWAVSALVGLVTVGSNYAAGRPLPLSIAFGIANAFEALVVGEILSRGTGAPALARMSDVARLLIATVAGALVIGVLAGATVGVLEGGQVVETFVAVLASHAAAVIVVVPPTLVVYGGAVARSRLELAAQIIVTFGVVGFVFSPANTLPLAFLSLPVLSWAAFNFSYGFVIIELLLTAVLTVELTAAGGGPFASAEVAGVSVTNQMLQVFLIAQAGTIIFLGAGRLERERLAEQVQTRGELLRGGLVGVQVGLLILQSIRFPEVRVLLGNDAASEMLDWPALAGEVDDLGPGGIVRLSRRDPATQIFDAYRKTGLSEERGEFTTRVGRRVQYFLSTRNSEFDQGVVTAQFVDITERYEAQLANQKALEHEQELVDQLRDLNRQKDDFVSSVSHELRTPITSILGFSEVMEDAVAEPELQEYVSVIQRNARRLADLVEDLLELGSMSASTPAKDSKAVDLHEVIRECVQEQSTMAKSRGVIVTTSLDRQSPSVGSVSHDLSRIVSNILSNAIKFSHSGGEVDVATSCTEEEVQLVISDTGPGIPPEDVERVFERFYRSPAEALRVIPGTGLGLPIVKSLVERHGGRIALTSDHVAGGTTVTVTMPRMKSSA